ncbi:HipA N-terminal domain-containing protein [Chitinophagaceae bacterium LB-8]|uniref:HipA N-terminal domain-containing protein n=1 Tax=Paraflavisolibacter caeni TaxID=2982496 RepID=A0A9X3B805_9BACT|nr:HipA N-terminal domain-containing protein [Paraflavisolibacter caeni]MCU7549905.1 HipA N-terminal domain-containing protein [Paraflavisolibacter caeni]
MAKGAVYINGELAGILEKKADSTYEFRYEDHYFVHEAFPPVSLTLPKSQQVYQSKDLFPFFFGLLAEGVNKDIQCRLLRIDEDDDFTRLLKTAGEDTIGAVTIKEMQ